jgi:hypothetical protein
LEKEHISYVYQEMILTHHTSLQCVLCECSCYQGQSQPPKVGGAKLKKKSFGGAKIRKNNKIWDKILINLNFF